MSPMLASLDSTAGQVTADVVLVALVLLNVYLGWRFGLLRRLVALAGVFVGCFAATNIGNAIAGSVAPHSLEANGWAFASVLLVVVIVVEVLGAMINDRLQRLVVVLFDRLVGSVMGGVVGLAEALLLFLVAIAVSSGPGGVPKPAGESAGHAISAATLAGPAARLEPQVRALFSPVLPANLNAHLTQGTTVTPLPL